MARMSDEDFDKAMMRSGAFGRLGPKTIAIRKEAVRARSEEVRLMEEIKKKDAEIARLKEQLSRTGWLP